MKVGLSGFGSIGNRHVSNLLRLGIRDIILFREKGKGNSLGLTEVYDYSQFADSDRDYFIICNPTSNHLSKIEPLLTRNRNVLVEKPLVGNEEECNKVETLLKKYSGKGMVAYNMRFHPCLKRIKEICGSGMLGKTYSVRFYVGQYLPDWRPGQEYSKGVSALKSLGGGVILELIHEIDMAVFLFGNPDSGIQSLAGKVSDLEIETEDISEIIFRTSSGTIVSVHQDYLSRDYRRTIEILAAEGSLFCDLKTATIKITGPSGKIILDEAITFERNDMYLSLIRYYTDCIETGKRPSPDLEESFASLRIALEAKKSNNL